jgi:hypothetical protein
MAKNGKIAGQSLVLRVVEIKSSFLAEHEVSGENDVPYSLTYSEKFNLLAAVSRGESISLSFDLVPGRVFKVLGLMLCI